MRQHVALGTEPTAGVFRREHLAGWGLDPGIVRAMTRRGWWTRLHHGVYADSSRLTADVEPGMRHATLCAAAIMALRLPAFAFGPSAAAIHGLPRDRGLSDTVELVRPLGTDQRALQRRITAPTRLERVTIHGHHLRPEDVTAIRGVPVVSSELAAVSTAAACSLEWAVVTLDAAAWTRPPALAHMSVIAEGWPRLRGIGVVRQALTLARAGAQTPLESISRLRLADAGLPEPELQVPHFDEDGLIGFADMTWRTWRVIGEADGAVKYETRDDLLAEKRREDRLRRQGFVVVRWTWDEIWRTPRQVASRIQRARS